MHALEIHHGKHHNAYVTNLNNAIAGTDAEKLSIEEICQNISKYPAPVRNNGGGHYNHSLFWSIMGPNAGGAPTGKLADAINASFTSFDEFKQNSTLPLRDALDQDGHGWSKMPQAI